MSRLAGFLLLCSAFLAAACTQTPAPAPEPAPSRAPAPTPPVKPEPAPTVPATPAAHPSPASLAATEAELATGVRLHPADPRAWNAWGLLAYQRRDYAAAAQRMSRAVELDPQFREAILNLGLARFAMREFAEAGKEFRRVLAFPTDPSLFRDYRLAQIEYAKRVHAGKIHVPFPEAVRENLLPVDRDGMFAKWYGRLAAIQARGPGFSPEYRAESAHYQVRTDDSEGLARAVAGLLELGLGEYRRLFPAGDGAGPVRRYAVTVFARRQDYVGYLSELLDDRATAHLSGGSYYPLLHELMLTKAPSFEQTRLVLLHEGFHQYMDSLGVSPPSWFGEGLADYFGASRLVGGNLEPGAGHPLRRDALKRALDGLTRAELAAVLQAGPDEFMGMHATDFRHRTARVGRNYALSWAFAHFLVESEYRPLLLRYYESIRKGADVLAAWREVLAPKFTDAFFRAFVAHARRLLEPTDDHDA